MTTTTASRRTQYQAITAAIKAKGFQVLQGYGKGGFWVRNPDNTKPEFVNENSFISFAKAKSIFA